MKNLIWLLFAGYQVTELNRKGFRRIKAPKGVQLFISLPFIIVKASLKNDLAILVDLLLEDSLPRSENN